MFQGYEGTRVFLEKFRVRLGQAYVLAGPDGVGKNSSSWLAARLRRTTPLRWHFTLITMSLKKPR
jgi:hypothetical protein